MPDLDRRPLLALCTLVTLASPGCGLDWEGDATVRFFATHAGTPGVDGYPDYGDQETTRVFVTDMGWQIALHEVFITTADVQFVRCTESTGTPIEMFWGPCPESFVSTNDLESVPLGAVNGVARRGEGPMLEEHPFSIVSDVEVVARLDTSTLEDDGPISLSKENFPRDLTVIKTYDRFFDGVDFSTATPADIEAAILHALEFETVVFDGTLD
jgi:hypothetical protein